MKEDSCVARDHPCGQILRDLQKLIWTWIFYAGGTGVEDEAELFAILGRINPTS
ncbi:MAG TPA: hypothetical protein VI386_35480 [Candidatus Sulfotelmatobacter sp.]